MATATPSKTTDSGTPAAKAPTPPLGRAVIWIGLALGTAVTVLAVMHGIRIPGLEVVLSVLVTWVLLIVLAVTVAELLRRHHRAMARHAWRHGKRGALFAGRRTRRARGGGRAARPQGGGPVAEPPAPPAHVHPHRSASRPQARPGRHASTPVLLTARSKSGRVLNPVTGEPVATVTRQGPGGPQAPPRRRRPVPRHRGQHPAAGPPRRRQRQAPHLKGQPPWQTPPSPTTAEGLGRPAARARQGQDPPPDRRVVLRRLEAGRGRHVRVRARRRRAPAGLDGRRGQRHVRVRRGDDRGL